MKSQNDEKKKEKEIGKCNSDSDSSGVIISGSDNDSEEEEEKEEDTREVVCRLQQQVHRLGSRVKRLEEERDVGRTTPLQPGGQPPPQQMNYLAFNRTAQAQENEGP